MTMSDLYSSGPLVAFELSPSVMIGDVSLRDISRSIVASSSISLTKPECQEHGIE